ncbi:hypothetical protein HNY73_006315 [Argiope bruennichi]|uniref:Uncharacterized protein n=1 Tax=Argiope bruennichi TaxID=94029 RepID=A0A8T0FKI4_ARGBR|nr:hypothetical protein HNY73_006315 [Argiope bruennichi]
MSAPTDSKLIIPFVPSLFHFSVVKVALKLSKHIDATTCLKLFKQMRRSDPEIFYETDSNSNSEIDKAKEKLLIIPAHLRENVVQAILGLDAAVKEWHSDHEGAFRSKNIDETFEWKSNGAIDRIKTMQQLLLKKDVDINLRFYLACCYFLEESIKTLWAEMDVNDKRSIPGNPCTRFWVRRMHDGCAVQWIKDIPEYLHLYWEYPTCSFGAFFPFLQPQERMKEVKKRGFCSDKGEGSGKLHEVESEEHRVLAESSFGSGIKRKDSHKSVQRDETLAAILIGNATSRKSCVICGRSHPNVGKDAPPIRVLLGADVLGSLLTGKIEVFTSGVSAVETLFGWAILGLGSKRQVVNMVTLTIQNIELRSVIKRLLKENIYEIYNDVLRQWQREGIIETIPDDEILKPDHYIPHRPVLKSSSATNKGRPVFDASFKRPGYASLNECLSVVPVFQSRFPNGGSEFPDINES